MVSLKDRVKKLLPNRNLRSDVAAILPTTSAAAGDELDNRANGENKRVALVSKPIHAETMPESNIGKGDSDRKTAIEQANNHAVVALEMQSPMKRPGVIQQANDNMIDPFLDRQRIPTAPADTRSSQWPNRGFSLGWRQTSVPISVNTTKTESKGATDRTVNKI